MMYPKKECNKMTEHERRDRHAGWGNTQNNNRQHTKPEDPYYPEDELSVIQEYAGTLVDFTTLSMDNPDIRQFKEFYLDNEPINSLVQQMNLHTVEDYIARVGLYLATCQMHGHFTHLELPEGSNVECPACKYNADTRIKETPDGIALYVDVTDS